MLQEMLQTRENSPYIRWNPSGNGFIIVSKKGFRQHVLPKYTQGSHQSFLRSVNYYQFKSASDDVDSCEYTHDVFHRDFPQRIVRSQRALAPASLPQF
jgi:hypothetical protein